MLAKCLATGAAITRAHINSHSSSCACEKVRFALDVLIRMRSTTTAAFIPFDTDANMAFQKMMKLPVVYSVMLVGPHFGSAVETFVEYERFTLTIAGSQCLTMV